MSINPSPTEFLQVILNEVDVYGNPFDEAIWDIADNPGTLTSVLSNPKFMALSIPATKTLYVDNQRTDNYAQTGSIQFPFKTIMAAVNQVILNGDNASIGYEIRISPGTYQETILLESSKLVMLHFRGASFGFLAGPVIVTGSGGVAGTNPCVQSTLNNTQLTDVCFEGFYFHNTGASPAINLVGDIDQTGFASDEFIFDNCTMVFGGSSGAIVATNVNVIRFSRSYLDAASGTFTNVYQIKFDYGTTINTGGTWTNTNNLAGNQPLFYHTISTQGTILARSSVNCAWTIGAGCQAVQYAAPSSSGSSWVVNGTLIMRQAFTQSITVNSGGVATAYNSTIAGAVTINSGGTYTSFGSTAGSISNSGTYSKSGVLSVGNATIGGLSAFANNAAAVSGGLHAGDLYRTGSDPDTVCVVH